MVLPDFCWEMEILPPSGLEDGRRELSEEEGPELYL